MIVTDTQMFVYLAFDGDWHDIAVATYTKDPVWVAPILWRSEFRNTLFGMLRRRELSIDEANEAWQRVEPVVRGREFVPEATDVFQFALSSRLTAYDAEFVAVAQSHGVPLVSADTKILLAFPDIALHPEAFVAGA